MSFLKSLFGLKDDPINSYEDFWNWFESHQKKFYKTVKNHQNIESDFFDKLSPKLEELKEGYYFVTGMMDDDKAELIFTADGSVKNFVFVEELVNAAPAIEHWKFTAHKPALDIKDVGISMAGYEFSAEKLHFYSNELPNYPDEIDISVVYDDYSKEDKTVITNGVFIFLDNFLGELDFAIQIDAVTLVEQSQAKEALVPISKLKEFLNWRQKEFVEKYDGLRYDTEEDNYAILEAELESGNNLIATINTDLLNWDGKASHPWFLKVSLQYGNGGNNGMPSKDIMVVLEKIENDIIAELKDHDGYLAVGRQTAEGVRELYFCCKDFRKPAKVLHHIFQKYNNEIAMDYDIFKDKYWLSLNRFKIN